MIRTFKIMLRSVREYKRPSIITLSFIVIEAIVETLIPFITANLINNIQRNGVDMGIILRTGLLLVLMALVSLVSGGVAGFTSAKAAAGFAKNLRHDLFYKVQTFSFENIDKYSSSSLVTRMTTDITHVQMSYMMLIRTAIRSPLMLIFSVVMALVMGGTLSLAFVVVIPVLAVGLFLIGRRAMPAFHRVFRKYDRLNESIEENVRGMRVVKGFSREAHEKDKFGRASGDIERDFTFAERILALNRPIMQICLYFNMIFVLVVGSKMTVESGGETINVGHISAMLTYGMQILMSLMMLSFIYIMITMSTESMKRIAEVLSDTPVLKNPEDPVTAVANGSIEFCDVSFKYSKKAERNALDGISFRIESGMTVGVIGGTGSGKTSLVQLIPRLYDVTTGSVTVGGVDVRDYDMTTLRHEVAMVLQKNLLFSGSIKENLLWGNPGATDEEIADACRLAQAAEFIESFPKGYETHIEQGGTNVSGGQRQRLCIARALLRKPKILILDDSTSAVDMKTDAKIREGFRAFIPETTKIIIAQRISSVADADMILVLENGRVTASGKHDELLRTCAIYKEIYEEQTQAGGDGDE